MNRCGCTEGDRCADSCSRALLQQHEIASLAYAYGCIQAIQHQNDLPIGPTCAGILSRLAIGGVPIWASLAGLDGGVFECLGIAVCTHDSIQQPPVVSK
jgi:hypothetical protein